MNAKRFVLGTLAGGGTMFLLGFVFYVLLLADFFAGNTGSASGGMRNPPLFWAIIVGELFFGALLTLVFGHWASIATATTGLRAGALLGLLVGCAFAFTLYGATNLPNLTATIADGLITAVRAAVAGAVVGLVLGKVR